MACTFGTSKRDTVGEKRGENIVFHSMRHLKISCHLVLHLLILYLQWPHSDFFPVCREEDAVNRGNTLYVTGLSSRVTERDVKDYFSKHGRVSDFIQSLSLISLRSISS